MSLAFIGLPHLVYSQELHVGIAEWPPYLMYQGDQPEGLVIELLRKVSARTGYTFIYHNIPQKRLLEQFRDAQVTLEPASNPSWRLADVDISLYSVPFIRAKNVVLMRRGSGFRATSASDFRGKVLGCDLGYVYTDGFEEEFGKGAIIRDDVQSGTKSNLLKLALKRVDGIIVDPLVASYWINEMRMEADRFEVVYELQEDNSLFMRLHVSQQAFLPELNKVLRELIAEGLIDKMVDQYTRVELP